MPSTLADLFEKAGLSPAGVVPWGSPVPLSTPGVYVVALTDAVDSTPGAISGAPLSLGAIQTWLDVRPELRLDGMRPDAEQLASRVASFWLPNEVVLYIGLAGTSLETRVGQYFKTPLGAKRPHAGGHLIKALANLDELLVHFAPAADPAAAEHAMIAAFVGAVSAEACSAIGDPAHPFPFANLEWPPGVRKAHGITGWRGELPAAPTTIGRPRRTARREREKPPVQRGTEVMSRTKLTLHEELARILREEGNRWMTREELAAEVNSAGHYRKKDGSAVTPFHVHGRTKNYGHLFERDGSRVRLRDGH